MKTHIGYEDPIPILGYFQKRFQPEELHLHGRNIDNWTTFKSIFQDKHYMLYSIMSNTLKGLFYFTVYGSLVAITMKQPPNQLQFRYGTKLSRNYVFRNLRSYAISGALYGLLWSFLHDFLLCPPQQSTFFREMTAYSIQGGLMALFIFGPSYISLGSAMALMTCKLVEQLVGMREGRKQQLLPVGFEAELIDFDEQKRQRIRACNFQSQMSKKVGVRAALTTDARFLPI